MSIESDEPYSHYPEKDEFSEEEVREGKEYIQKKFSEIIEEIHNNRDRVLPFISHGVQNGSSLLEASAALTYTDLRAIQEIGVEDIPTSKRRLNHTALNQASLGGRRLMGLLVASTLPEDNRSIKDFSTMIDLSAYPYHKNGVHPHFYQIPQNGPKTLQELLRELQTEDPSGILTLETIVKNVDHPSSPFHIHIPPPADFPREGLIQTARLYETYYRLQE